jgi:hypothetical protein
LPPQPDGRLPAIAQQHAPSSASIAATANPAINQIMLLDVPGDVTKDEL